MVSERDAITLQRQAYRLGFFSRGERFPRTAEEVYPFPKITRQRVRQDSFGINFMVSNGDIWFADKKDCFWERAGGPDELWKVAMTPERVLIVADLLANPTETVEDDGTD